MNALEAFLTVVASIPTYFLRVIEFILMDDSSLSPLVFVTTMTIRDVGEDQSQNNICR